MKSTHAFLEDMNTQNWYLRKQCRLVKRMKAFHTFRRAQIKAQKKEINSKKNRSRQEVQECVIKEDKFFKKLIEQNVHYLLHHN